MALVVKYLLIIVTTNFYCIKKGENHFGAQ